MEAFRAFSERENALGTLANHVVSDELQSEKENPMRGERTVNVIHRTLRGPIADTPGLIGEAVIALVTPEAHNGVKKADNQLQAIIQGFGNKTLDKKLNFVEFEQLLFDII